MTRTAVTGGWPVGPDRADYGVHIHNWAGAAWADWLFMLGLLGIGLALVAGIGLRLDRGTSGRLAGQPKCVLGTADLKPGSAGRGDPAAVDGFGAFLAGLGNIGRVGGLPFHRLGAHKYDALGIPFPLRDTPSPDPDLTERGREQFRGHGLRAL
ncbi:hypothetical protein FBY35_0216 [Streptomyces sp. SLBN-118]|nr:hypothetical protein FBY35_0216 [Streptomyces sp. SLBN-118]